MPNGEGISCLVRWRSREPELDDALLYWGDFEVAVFGPWFVGFQTVYEDRNGGAWQSLMGSGLVGLTALWVFRYWSLVVVVVLVLFGAVVVVRFCLR